MPIHKISKKVSGYLSSEDGPFECENCGHFKEPASCEIVEGHIDPEGCCNLYVKGAKDTDEADEYK